MSGTDEHGQKVEQSAEKQGLDPQDFVDQVSTSFRDLLELMNISNDKFIRTTSEEHKRAVQVRIIVACQNKENRVGVFHALFRSHLM